MKSKPEPDGYCQKFDTGEVDSETFTVSLFNDPTIDNDYFPVWLVTEPPEPPVSKDRLKALEVFAEKVATYFECVASKWEDEMGQEEKYLLDMYNALPEQKEHE